VSELLLAPVLGVGAAFALNCLVAVGWMALLVSLVHLACRVTRHDRGHWTDLFVLWGYTQVPAVILAVLTVAFLGLVPPAWRAELGVAWAALAVAVAVLLSLWGMILKLQAIRISYDLSGQKLLRVIVLAFALYGVVAWAEVAFVADRGLVPFRAVRAMAPAVQPFHVRWRAVSLPFDKLTYHLRQPARGEIVGFAPPESRERRPAIFGPRVRFVGRVVGMPGDEVEIRGGQVYLAGRPYGEPYRLGGADRHVAPTKVPPGFYFVLGDNRDVPLAAYHGGLVAEARLRGRLTDVGRLKWEFLLGKGIW
jgi:signal peptidase I